MNDVNGESTSNKLTTSNRLMSGWKALNKATGDCGFMQGEVWLISSLRQNSKSAFSSKLSTSLMMFNSAAPYATDGLKPMFLDISFGEHLPIKIIKIKDKEVQQKIKSNGWTITHKVLKNPLQFTASQLSSILDYYAIKGFNIVCCRIDSSFVMQDYEAKSISKKFINVVNQYNMLMIVTSDLSPLAEALNINDPLNFIPSLPDGFCDEKPSLVGHATGVIYVGIKTVNDQQFIEVQLGKHRRTDGVKTPDIHKYFVMPFNNLPWNIGTLPWDIDF